MYISKFKFVIQWNLDLVTLNLVTTCDLVTIFYKDHFSIYYIKSFDLVTLCNLVTVFAETKSVTKSRLHCTRKYGHQRWQIFSPFGCERLYIWALLGGMTIILNDIYSKWLVRIRFLHGLFFRVHLALWMTI